MLHNAPSVIWAMFHHLHAQTYWLSFMHTQTKTEIEAGLRVNLLTKVERIGCPCCAFLFFSLLSMINTIMPPRFQFQIPNCQKISHHIQTSSSHTLTLSHSLSPPPAATKARMTTESPSQRQMHVWAAWVWYGYSEADKKEEEDGPYFEHNTITI